MKKKCFICKEELWDIVPVEWSDTEFQGFCLTHGETMWCPDDWV